MSNETQSAAPFLSLRSGSPAIRTVLDLLPCAIALWGLERRSCVLNYLAAQLTGFSAQDFHKDPSLWMNRIHVEDRDLVSYAWKKLRNGEKMVSCDYRFFPNGDKKEIWLRDVSVSYQNPHGDIEGIASTYTNISDLKATRRKKQKEDGAADIVGIIDGLVHEIQNNLQVISMGLDLLRLDRGTLPDREVVINGIERAKKSLRDLSEYFSPPETQFSTEDPAIILEELVRRTEKELDRQRIRVRMVRRGPLPMVRIDSKQFRSALERVLEFSRALLPQGGELEVEVGLREIDAQRYVELQMASSSATSLQVEEKDVFRPFLRVNNFQVGLGIALAHQILRRHHGKIFFQKENPHRGLFTILLRVLSG